MEYVRATSCRFTTRELLGVTAYVCFMFAAARIVGSLDPVIPLSLGLVGWVMYRFGRGHLAGIIPALVAPMLFRVLGPLIVVRTRHFCSE